MRWIRGDKVYPAAGIPELRRAVAEYISQNHELEGITDEHVIVSAGAKHSIYNAMMAILNPGDEVIIPAPYWLSYPVIVTLASGIPVFVPTTLEERFILTPEKLRNAITRRTRMIILNNPSNPTGTVYNRRTQGLWDDNEIIPTSWCYPTTSTTVFTTKEFCSVASFSDEARKRTNITRRIQVYAMTGWALVFPSRGARSRKLWRTFRAPRLPIRPRVEMAALERFEAAGVQEEMRQEFNRRRHSVEPWPRFPASNFIIPRRFLSAAAGANILGKLTPDGICCATTSMWPIICLKSVVAVEPGTPFAPWAYRLSRIDKERIGMAIDRIAQAVSDLRDPGADRCVSGLRNSFCTPSRTQMVVHRPSRKSHLHRRI
jgi:aspartate aminotransferase